MYELSYVSNLQVGCACNFVFLPYIMEESAKIFAENMMLAESNAKGKRVVARHAPSASYKDIGSLRDNIFKLKTLQFKFINSNEYCSNPSNEYNGIYNFVGRANAPPAGLPQPWAAQAR